MRAPRGCRPLDGHLPAPDPARGAGAWDWLGNSVNDAVASTAARITEPSPQAVVRRTDALKVAAAVHTLFAEAERATAVVANRAGESAVYVPQRRRRTTSPPWRRVLCRVAAPGRGAPHAAVHDLRAAHGPWPRVRVCSPCSALALARRVHALQQNVHSRGSLDGALAHAVAGRTRFPPRATRRCTAGCGVPAVRRHARQSAGGPLGALSRPGRR